MKEDKFVASVFKGAQYARENTRNMVILVAVLAVIIIGVFGVRYYLSSQTEAAETKLGIAQIAYQAGEYQECRDSLLVVANKYSSSKPARVAEFLLGHMYYAFGMPDTAKIYWDKFIASKSEDKDMRAAASMGLAAILSDQGKFADAAAAFEKVYTDYPAYFDRNDGLYKAADNYRVAGQAEKARELFQKYIVAVGDSPQAKKAKLILAELNAK
jgi:TolA-binding protein